MPTKRVIGAIKASLTVLIFSSIFHISQSYADLSVGDSYGEGTVFCVSQTADIKNCVTQGSGKYGLIMANEDQVNFDSNAKHGVTWSKERKETGALSYDDGLANTRAIIAAHPQDNPSNNAAWLIQEYNKAHGQDANGNLTVWYLPAKNELNKMYLYAKANGLIGKGCVGSKPNGIQCLIGGGDYEGNKDWNKDNRYKVYWSSTECSGDYGSAWRQAFNGGGQYRTGKDNVWLGVRAVRAFNNLTIQPFSHLPKPKSPQALGLKVPAVSPKVAVSAAPQGAAVAQIQPQAPVQAPVVPLQHAPQAAVPTTPIAPPPPVAAPAAPTPTPTPTPVPAPAAAAAVPPTPAPAPTAAPAAATPSPSATVGADRFTLGEGGDKLARLGNLTRLYPPNYQLPTLIQALTDAGVPMPGEVVAHCNDVAACAVADGAVDCVRLTEEDAAAIAMYTYDFGGADAAHNPYRLINQGLFERNAPQLRRLRGIIYRLLHALRSVEPVRPQALFRGIRERVRLNDTHYHEGNKITWHSFSSTTTKMGVTQNFLTDRNTGKCEGTLFVITGMPWGYNIQPFSCFPGEEEILLEPEIELRVTGVVNPPVGLIVVNLEMLSDQRLLLERLIPRNIGGVVTGGGSSSASSPMPTFAPPVAPPSLQYRRYIAQTDWQSTVAGGLSFRRGDIISIIEYKDGWWMGELNGQRGWVPPSFLQPETPGPAPQAY